jgi:hypothetical protein
MGIMRNTDEISGGMRDGRNPYERVEKHREYSRRILRGEKKDLEILRIYGKTLVVLEWTFYLKKKCIGFL